MLRRSLTIFILGLSSIVLTIPAGAQQPVKIQLGHSSTAEEPLWLVFSKPELVKNYGKSYVIEPARFAAGDKRFLALESGAIDMAAMTGTFTISAAAEGADLRAIATITQESLTGFQSFFAVPENSPIKGPADLKGKTIGISGYQGAGHLWAKAVLTAHGIAETDVTLANVRFPTMAEALKAGKVDVGMFVQPFAAMAQQELKMRKIFTSKDAAPFDEEAVLIVVKAEYLAKNGNAIRDFLADLKTAMKYYNENTRAARQILLDTKMVGIAPKIYLDMEDYAHRPSLEINVSSLEKMQDAQVRAGFQLKRADLKKLVDNSYLPKD